MNEEKQRRARIIPGAHQEKRSILFYSLIFFFYGFFIDFKPSEPFLVPYLIKVKGFTNDQVFLLLMAIEQSLIYSILM